MRSSRTLIALGATGALTAPVAATIALADAAPAVTPAPSADALRAPLASAPTLRAQMRGVQHDALLARYRRAAQRIGTPSPGARTWSNGRLRQAIAAARAQRAKRAAAARTATAGAGAPSGALAAIAQCESGGDPDAVGGGGTFRGLYQFDAGTWASVGGSGDPAAASAAEQTRRAQILYSRAGSAPWPVCGR